MKVIIDETVCSNYNITLDKVLVGLLCKLNINIEKVIQDLLSEQEIKELDHNIFKVDKEFGEKLTQIMLNSDTSIPNIERCENLVIQMRALYPKGNNGAGYPWRGNIKDLTKRLQKFFKIYGNHTDEDIINATQKYISHFNGNYTFMRTLKYFILKSENGEENSDLATWLDNDGEESTNDWLTDVR